MQSDILAANQRPNQFFCIESIEPVATKQAARSVGPAELAQGHA